ncbi:MAG TPA: FHA domain-containing protein [Gemmatimonadales bacterium]|nr:FHA domain-containing protein [Gemmatimonadales bacterium]
MTACAFCGRDNDAGAEFCSDCGKSLLGKLAGLQGVGRGTSGAKGAAPHPQAATRAGSAAATRSTVQTAVAPSCRFCAAPLSGDHPFCSACGRRLTSQGSGPSCARCGAPHSAGAQFCATCGVPVAEPAPTLPRGAVSAGLRETEVTTLGLALLNELGDLLERFERPGPHVTIGREDADLTFPDDAFLSPLHAKLSFEPEAGGLRLVIRDLGSRNGTWVFLEAAHRLDDGDLLLVGSQVIRFRRLGYPGPHAADADATKRMGSVTPAADIASLTQLRADGSARDVIHLSPGHDIQIGRERGHWIFPYDPSMSAVHATIRSEDADFVVIDARSRNGIAVAARGAVPLSHASRILVGDKLLRIELPAAPGTA